MSKNNKEMLWLICWLVTLSNLVIDISASNNCPSYCVCPDNHRSICTIDSNPPNHLMCKVLWRNVRLTIKLNETATGSTFVLPSNFFAICDSVERLDISSNSHLTALTSDSLSHLRKLTFLTAEQGGLINSLGDDFMKPVISLKILKIYRNQIRHVQSRSMSRYCGSLTSLDLTGNGVEIIEDGAFAACSKLQHLRLGNNKLSTFNPKMLDGLAALQSLTLNKNQIVHFPDAAFSMVYQLQKLDLRSNMLERVNNAMLLKLFSLKSLDLSKNRISILAPDLFAHLVSLETLNLAGNQNIGSLDWSVLSPLTRLTQLNLGDKSVSCVVENGLPQPNSAVRLAFSEFPLCSGETRPPKATSSPSNTQTPKSSTLQHAGTESSDGTTDPLIMNTKSDHGETAGIPVKLNPSSKSKPSVKQSISPQVTMQLIYRIPIWMVAVVCGMAIAFLSTFALLITCCTIQSRKIRLLKSSRGGYHCPTLNGNMAPQPMPLLMHRSDAESFNYQLSTAI